MADIHYPPYVGARGPGYWLRPSNVWASRQGLLRLDYSNEWRYAFGAPDPADRVVSPSRLLPSGREISKGFRFIILADTGEGDRSQYGLLPLLRALEPDFMIINGDVAYPAGRVGGRPAEDDFLLGFFQPYRNFRCAIWATPGNHEYYSSNSGRDFYDIFCTRKFDALWAEHGLRHDTLQPGMYWELSDPTETSKLVVIGLDSGMAANLDGKNNWWQFWKRRIQPDSLQHNWFESRLRRAQDRGLTVIVLFHIPALVKERHKEAHLATVHSILSRYPCVRLVLCGHEHNYQAYASSVFQQYVGREFLKRDLTAQRFPEYVVCGAGGAYLQNNGYSAGPYASLRYPSKDQWDQFVGMGRRVVARLGLDKMLAGRIAGIIDHDSLADADATQFLSFLLVEDRAGEGGRVVVTPVFLRNLSELFERLPAETIVDVTSEHPPVDPDKVKACLQTPFVFG